ncbi:hypothetical protein BD779DRAFT_1414049, partial [Infundibulicybe gibba]
LTIKTDSQYVIDGLTRNLNTWEDQGWIGIANREIFKATIAAMRIRKGTTYLTKVKGHSGDIGNDGADAEACKGANKQTDDPLDLQIGKNLCNTGAKLSELTQALAYKGINEYLRHKTPTRRKTEINLERIRHAIAENMSITPTNTKIWKS